MKTHDEPLASRALHALGEECQIPPDVEDRILAALPFDLLDGPAEGESDSGTAGPNSGVFRSSGDAVTSLSLSALEEQCAIPRDVEDRILDSLLGPPAPVIHVTGRPLDGLIRRARKDAVRERRIGVSAALGAVIVAVLVLLIGIPPAGAPAPVNVNATQVPDGDPLLDEVRAALTDILVEVARDCHLRVGSAVVWFEKSGYVSVLEVQGSTAGSAACIERVTARHWLDPHDRATLVQLTVDRAPGPRDRDPGSGAPDDWPPRRSVRITAWRVDET